MTLIQHALLGLSLLGLTAMQVFGWTIVTKRGCLMPYDVLLGISSTITVLLWGVLLFVGVN